MLCFCPRLPQQKYKNKCIHKQLSLYDFLCVVAKLIDSSIYDNTNACFRYAQIWNACQKHKHLDESNPHHPAKDDIFMLLRSSYTELKDYKNATICTKQITNIDIYGNLCLLYDYMINEKGKYLIATE